MDLDRLRTDLESFTRQLSREYYMQGAGLKDDINFTSLYSAFPSLFTFENLESIKQAYRSSFSKTEKRRLRYLLESFHGEIVLNTSSKLQNKFLSKESTGILHLNNNEDVSYRSSLIKLYNAGSRNEREAIWQARNRFIEAELNPIVEQIYYMENGYAIKNGYNDKLHMFEELSGINLSAIDKDMQELVKETESIYVELLTKAAKEKLNLKLSELKPFDLQILSKSNEFTSYFPKEKMFSTIAGFIGKMGLDIEAGKNINFDIDIRDKKSPRAFCCPVVIPSEIYLVIYPRGGEDDYMAFLHELGHAQHFGNMQSDLEFEFKWYGDNSVTEGYAMTFDHLLNNEQWIKKIIGLNSREYLNQRLLNELMMLRRYAGKIQYELQLYRDMSLKGKKELYSKITSDIMKVEYPSSEYLTSVDSNFYCARYLRAWMFQHALNEHLTNNFGNDWFINGATGSFLKEIWSYGQMLNAEELLKEVGSRGLSVQPVIRSLNSVN
ncbi:MAG: hypothetical protein EHM58_17165 [Ignavibacteriae bacterium]|nr:MAG: hypothetical protein EHM58_17165 [Ignavibacteriota bacterium]